MVVRGDGPAEHRAFSDLPSLLTPGDLLVVNDTRVVPARITAMKEPSGGRVEILALRPLPDGGWACLVRPSGRVPVGQRLRVFARGSGAYGPMVVAGERFDDGSRRIDGLTLDDQRHYGEMPLPPYIDRTPGPVEEDRERYQTVYARDEGAVAAPTAGLHFTDALLAELAGAGVPHARVTLHVGAGTFAPIREERVADVRLHAEPWRVPPETCDAIASCEARGGRVVAVGTTTCRTLEAWHRADRPRDGRFRETELFLHPGAPATMDMALITNFHTPGSSLVMLVASRVGRARILALYDEAAAAGYRFFSYGDAMLFL